MTSRAGSIHEPFDKERHELTSSTGQRRHRIQRRRSLHRPGEPGAHPHQAGQHSHHHHDGADRLLYLFGAQGRLAERSAHPARAQAGDPQDDAALTGDDLS